MSLFFKALLGALAVLLIAVLSKTKNYYLAALVPLFPTFALIAHLIIGQERTKEEFKITLLFGMWSLGPYFIYLLCVYLFIDRFTLGTSLFFAACMWAVSASVLSLIWSRLY